MGAYKENDPSDRYAANIRLCDCGATYCPDNDEYAVPCADGQCNLKGCAKCRTKCRVCEESFCDLHISDGLCTFCADIKSVLGEAA